MAKQTSIPFLARTYKSSQPFFFIHSDIWGPSRVNNLSKEKWFITFIDDHSRTTWVYLVREKYEAEQTFKIVPCHVKNPISN